MKIFFSYFGGKYRIALKYPKPVGDTIIEPFAGSAGYSIRYPDKKIMLFDRNERIVGVWKYLIQAKESSILNLPEVFDDVRDLPISQEEKWLIGFWINKGGVEPRNKPSSWMKNKSRPKSHWGSEIKQRIATQLKFIRHWQCELETFENIPYSLNSSNITWFIDPPYLRGGQHYTYHEIDYAILTDFCKNRIGQTIVCESAGADWLEFKTLCLANKRRGKILEVYWTNV